MKIFTILNIEMTKLNIISQSHNKRRKNCGLSKTIRILPIVYAPLVRICYLNVLVLLLHIQGH